MSALNARKIKHKQPGTLRSDAVFGLLKGRILRCEYTPGTPLAEVALANELKVSRTPIREALRRLEHEQLVRIIPHKGAIVTGLAEADIVEAYLIRQALEGICARRAAERLSDENLARLELRLQEATECLVRSERGEASEIADELHRMILDVGGTPRIRRMVASLCELTNRLNELALSLPGRLERSIAEHTAVAAALRRRDGQEAEQLIRSHIASTERDVLAAFRNRRRANTGEGIA